MLPSDALGGLAKQNSENTAEAYTPEPLFNLLNEEFNFTLDPCEATFGPKLCPDGYMLRDNGLTKNWYRRVYMNPPYGRSIVDWVKKAYIETEYYGRAEIVVGLIPVRSDTRWWHDWVLDCASEIRFLYLRIRFIGPDRKPMKGRAPFASAIVIWDRNMNPPMVIKSMNIPKGAK